MDVLQTSNRPSKAPSPDAKVPSAGVAPANLPTANSENIIEPTGDPNTPSSSGVSKYTADVGEPSIISVLAETAASGRSASVPLQTLAGTTDPGSTPTGSHQNDMAIDTSLSTASTTGVGATTTPAMQQSSSANHAAKRLETPAPPVVHSTTTQQAPTSADNAERQRSMPASSGDSVAKMQQATLLVDNAARQPRTTVAPGHTVKIEPADAVRPADALESLPKIPSEGSRDEPTNATVPLTGGQEITDWRSLPFAFHDMLTNSFEVLDTVASDEPRLICRMCYDT